jgi:hypothetical protein
MGFFTKWMTKRGGAKSYPKDAAEWYVTVREQQPTLNIYAIISQIIRRDLVRWSFSPEQGQRLISRVRSIAQSAYNPSDYHVLLKFCAELPYIEGNTHREKMPPDLRKVLYDAALEGLNEGLGSYLYTAKSLYTTRSSEGLEHHPVSGARSNIQSGDESEQGDDSESDGMLAEGVPDDNYELAETMLDGVPESKTDPAREPADVAGGKSAFASEFRKIARYMDRLYPPVKRGDVSLRCFELPERHVLFVLCFNGQIRSRAVSFSSNTIHLHFDLPDVQETIDNCLSNRANEKTYFHLCLSLMNGPDYYADVRRSIKKGLVPVFYVIAKDEDRTIRLTRVARFSTAESRDSESELESEGALDA